MEGWMIILGIVLVRGIGAWLKRRNARLEKSAPPDSASDGPPSQLPPTWQRDRSPAPSPPPQEDFELIEEGEWMLPWESKPPAPVPPPPVPEAPLPLQEGPAKNAGYKFEAAGARADLEDQERQALLQRLAAATPMGTALPGPDVSQAARPHASAAARIHHGKHLASALLHTLHSPEGMRQAMLLREILGPPVARRGPLR